MKEEKDKLNEINGKSPGQMKKKGFYVSLYSCVGIMLVIAVVISYTNFSEPLSDPAPRNQYAAEDNSVEVARSEDQSFMAQITDGQDDGTGLSSLFNRKPEETAAPTTASTATPVPTKAPVSQESAETAPTTEPAQPTSQAQMPRSETFGSYVEADKMMWPLIGEIVMDFSIEHLIYDRTLEQYRTNDSICIAAEVGDEVRASADGIVTDIYTSREYGKTVVIDHGNGWMTRYSQLDDFVAVSVGDVVRAGNAIGGIGYPSIYSVALGAHLEFEISRNNEPVNPKDILVH